MITANVAAKWRCGLGVRAAYTYTHIDTKDDDAQYAPTRPHTATSRVEYGKDWKKYGFNIALSGQYLSQVKVSEYDVEEQKAISLTDRDGLSG